MNIPVKVRLSYQIKGRLRFLSHLEATGAIDKALRIFQMQGLPLVVTEGYSPKLKVSYSEPRSVGMSSLSEYIDVNLNADSDQAAREMADGMVIGLNERFSGRIKFLAPEISPVKKKANSVTMLYVLKPKVATTGQDRSSMQGEQMRTEQTESLMKIFHGSHNIRVQKKDHTIEVPLPGRVELRTIRIFREAHFVFVEHQLSQGSYLSPMAFAKALTADPDIGLEIADVRRIRYS